MNINNIRDKILKYVKDNNMDIVDLSDLFMDIIKGKKDNFDLISVRGLIAYLLISYVSLYESKKNKEFFDDISYLYSLSDMRDFNVIDAFRFNPKWLENIITMVVFEVFYNNMEVIEVDNEFTLKVKRDLEDTKDYVSRDCLTLSERELFSGVQQRNSHNEYRDNNVFIASDVGKRGNQEDAVIETHRKEDNSIKLLAVSDGVGSLLKGEYASYYTLRELSNWFHSLDLELFDDIEDIKIRLDSLLNKINWRLYRDTNGNSACTLTAAIVLRDKTIIVNVGDSRAYIEKNGKLEMITFDETRVYDKLFDKLDHEDKEMTLEDIDSLRFMAGNNVLNNAICFDKYQQYTTIFDIYNEAYDRIFLFTDGITDLLSGSDIEIISRKKNIDEVAHYIVEKALKDSIKNPDNDEIIEAGKDNATTLVYIKK